MAFENHLLAVREVAGFFWCWGKGCCGRRRGLDGGEYGDDAGGVGGGMSGGDGSEISTTPIVAIEGVDRMVELVGGV